MALYQYRIINIISISGLLFEPPSIMMIFSQLQCRSDTDSV